jgi:hypothetical protein
MPSIRQRLDQNGMHGMLGHDAYAKLLAKEFAEWPGEIKKLGITAE